MADSTARVFPPNRLAVLGLAMSQFRRLAAQDENDWVSKNNHDLSAESYQSLVLLCVSGLTEQVVRQAHDVGDARHVLRACVSGDYFKQYELSCRHQVDLHFGPGNVASPWQAPQIESVRLSEEGLLVGEDDARFLLRRVQGGGPPEPGRIEWLGWEVIDTKPDHDVVQLATEETGGSSAASSRKRTVDRLAAVRQCDGLSRTTDGDAEAAGASTSSSAAAPHVNRAAASGFVGGVSLAEALGVHPTRRNAFFRQLERKRLELGDECWHEVREPRPNQPRFIYRLDAPRIQNLAADYRQPKSA